MVLNTIEILATILIGITGIKLLFLFFNPKGWLGFSKRVYSHTRRTQVILLALSLVVLYYLISAGMSIVEVLAVTLFVSLVVGAQLASYVSRLIKITKTDNILKDYLWIILFWVVLLLWGVREIFF